MIPALNLGSGYLPYGMRATDLPDADDAPEQDDCLLEQPCSWCGYDKCMCDEETERLLDDWGPQWGDSD